MGLATTNGWLRRKWAGMHPKKNDFIDFRHHNLSGRVTYANNVASVDVPQVQFYRIYDFEGNRVWLSDSLGGQVWYSWNNQRLQSMAMTTEAGKYAGVDFTYDQVGRLNYISRTANWDLATTINTGLMLYVMKSLHHF